MMMKTLKKENKEFQSKNKNFWKPRDNREMT